MAETEVATETREKPRGGLFGRRKQQQEEEPETYRSETEWVDTLQSYEGEDAPVEAPFNGEALTGLPEEAGPYTSPAERAHWKRRSGDSIEDIEDYIDTVLGTAHDPLRKMTRPTARDFGLQERVQRARVEGIDHEIMIAFPFPADEFAGARVVYETEGGYVLEVKRKRGTSTETHHFTVSKVGEVAHVLDKLRKLDRKELERAIAEQAAQDRDARRQTEQLPEEYQAGPTTGAVKEEVTEAEPGLLDRAAPDTSEIGTEPAIAPSETPPAAPEEWPEEGTMEPQKKGLLGRFGRRKDEPEAPSEMPTEAAASDEVAEDPQEKKGLLGRFGRKKDEAHPEEEAAPLEEEQSQKKAMKLRFGRKKGTSEEEAEAH